jgi:hypothetical protein
MHFEILIEDQSGKKMLEILVPKIIGNEHSYRIISYKGIGHIPKNLKGSSDPSKRILLDRLPRLLHGYGKTFASYPPDYHAVVILVCDLDDKCMKAFREELYGILNRCNPQPETRFCIAIEEGEAWFFGDVPAVKRAYPRAKESILRTYKNDDICGTWEQLADAIYPGGSQKLSSLGWQQVGAEKSSWAEKITPHMDVENNNSPSFCYFRQKIRELVGMV